MGWARVAVRRPHSAEKPIIKAEVHCLIFVVRATTTRLRNVENKSDYLPATFSSRYRISSTQI